MWSKSKRPSLNHFTRLLGRAGERAVVGSEEDCLVWSKMHSSLEDGVEMVECGGSRVAVGEKRPSRKTPYKSISDFAFIALEGAVVVVVLGCPPIRVFSLTRNSPLTLNLDGASLVVVGS